MQNESLKILIVGLNTIPRVMYDNPGVLRMACSLTWVEDLSGGHCCCDCCDCDGGKTKSTPSPLALVGARTGV